METKHEDAFGSQAADTTRYLEPLGPDNASALKLTRATLFTPPRLIQYIAEHPGLSWKIAGQNEYVIGGVWRHRPEIGQIVEMTYGRHRELLLSFIVDLFRQKGAKLVVVALDDFAPQRAFYIASGFERLDEIIELERRFREMPTTRTASIREMEASDLSQVLAVDEASFPWLWRNSREELEWYRRQRGVSIYVADGEKNGVVGYAGFTVVGREGHLDRLAVLPDQQGKGIGAALLRFSLERMAASGAKRISLSTQLSNKTSQQLYRKFGFSPSFRSQKIFGLWLDRGTSED